MKVANRTILVTGALASVAALTLAGCAPTEADLAESGTTTITLWVDVERAPALKDVAAQFKEDTGITVKLEVKDFGTVDQDFISQVPTGKGPDIIVSPHDKLGAYVANGVVAPLELGDKAALFADSAVQAMTYEGTVYGVPYSIENIALVRNAALVPEAVTTFDEVIANGEAFAGSDADTIVPLEHGRRLFAAANEPKQFILLRGHDHNMPLSSKYYKALAEFLK